MDSLRESPVRLDGRVLEPSHGVEPGPRRVDDGAGLDGDDLAGEPVVHLGPPDPAGNGAERDDLCVVEHRGACLRRRRHVGQAEAAVVGPGVLVDATAAKAVEPEAGNASPRPLGPDESTELLTGERRVRPQPRLNRGRAIWAAAVDREQERDAPDEVRRDDTQQRPPLRVGFPHELHVAEPEVAQAAVDQLRRGARRGAAEIGAVDERDAQTGSRCLVGQPCSDDPAADHEEVVRGPCELGARSGAAWAHGHSGLVQAFPPRASVTSTRAYAAVPGRSSRAAVIQPSGSRLEDLAAVAVAEPAGVDRGAARDAEHGGDAPTRVAAHLDGATTRGRVEDPGARGGVEAAGPEGVEHALDGLVGANPGPGAIRVEPRMVAVVGGEREAHSARGEQLVPMHRRDPPADLELAAGVVDLEARNGLRKLERRGRDSGPVRVGEVGDAAVRCDPCRRAWRGRGGHLRARRAHRRSRTRARARRDRPAGGSSAPHSAARERRPSKAGRCGTNGP